MNRARTTIRKTLVKRRNDVERVVTNKVHTNARSFVLRWTGFLSSKLDRVLLRYAVPGPPELALHVKFHFSNYNIVYTYVLRNRNGKFYMVVEHGTWLYQFSLNARTIDHAYVHKNVEMILSWRFRLGFWNAKREERRFDY